VHLSVESVKPLERLRADLAAALAERGYRVTATTDGRPALRASGREGRGSLVIEVEDPLPGIARDEASRARADATTWRIAAYETDRGTTRLSTIRPTRLVELLDHPEHAAAAERLEHDFESVLRRAAGNEG
jgi:hypothetical protein